MSKKHQTRGNISISQTEIPIWVADQKKWVTGVSKKTTVNELIFVVLKKCQIHAPALLKSPSSSSSNHRDPEYVLAELELSSLTALSEQQQSEAQTNRREVTSERIIDGDSKVCKHIDKWINAETKDSILLKILQREPLDTSNSNEGNSKNPNNKEEQSRRNGLGSKILKKLGFNVFSSKALINDIVCKYGDVKLPKVTSTVSLNSLQPLKFSQVVNSININERLNSNLKSISFANLQNNQLLTSTQISRLINSASQQQQQQQHYQRTLPKRPNLGGASMKYMRSSPSLDNLSTSRMVNSTSIGYLPKIGSRVEIMSSNIIRTDKNEIWDENNNEETKEYLGARQFSQNETRQFKSCQSENRVEVLETLV